MTSQIESLARPADAREVAGNLFARAARMRSKPWFGATLRALRWAWPLALVAYLVSYLVSLGWAEIGQSMPSAWLFFALIPVLYVLPAAGDLLIYRRIWQIGRRLRLSIMLRKNAINTTVVGLSGEFYLVFWARRNIDRPARYLLHSVTDSNALSTLAGWALLSGLLVLLAMTDEWSIPLLSADFLWLAIVAASVPSLLFAIVLVARRIPTVLSSDQLVYALTVHMVRTVTGYGLLIWLWSLALPSAPVSLWLNFLALRLLVSAVAIVPNRELLWLSAGVGMAGFMELPQAGVAAMLLTMTAGEYVCHLLFVGLPAVFGKAPPTAASSQPAI